MVLSKWCRTGLGCFAARLTVGSCSALCLPTPPGPAGKLLPSLYHYKVVSLPMCGTQHLSLLNFIRSLWPILSGCTGPSGWQPWPQACWLSPPAWCCLQTWHHSFSSSNILSFEYINSQKDCLLHGIARGAWLMDLRGSSSQKPQSSVKSRMTVFVEELITHSYGRAVLCFSS